MNTNTAIATASATASPLTNEERAKIAASIEAAKKKMVPWDDKSQEPITGYGRVYRDLQIALPRAFYTRAQVEAIARLREEGDYSSEKEEPLLQPIELERKRTWSDKDFALFYDITKSRFPGTENSLYGEVPRYVYHNVGWARGDNFYLNVLLTPWEETQWGSREACIEAERLDAEREKAEAEAERQREAERRKAEAEAEAANKREYAKRCFEMARNQHVYHGVALVLGHKPEAYSLWKWMLKGIPLLSEQEARTLLHELSCGYNRRYSAMEKIFGKEWFHFLESIPSRFGQAHSKRLAKTIAEEIERVFPQLR